jgi:hypothetical protein
MGRKERVFSPLPRDISLADLVPKDHFYRHLEATVDLSFVREVVADRLGAKREATAHLRGLETEEAGSSGSPAPADRDRPSVQSSPRASFGALLATNEDIFQQPGSKKRRTPAWIHRQFIGHCYSDGSSAHPCAAIKAEPSRGGGARLLRASP